MVRHMTLARQALGGYGERRAVRHLELEGLRVVGRNWRCPHGEIDIIAWDGDDIVFCEVKTRRGDGYGTPAEAVVPAKARRLRRLATRWLQASGAHPSGIRFDVIEVYVPERGMPWVNHIRAAF